VAVLVHNSGAHEKAAREAAKKAANDIIAQAKNCRGKDLADVRQIIPDTWIASTPKKVPPGGATKWEPPIKTGQQIIYESGWPNHADLLHQGPYLRVSDGKGPVERVPLKGNLVLP
jgi:hypothetical protein